MNIDEFVNERKREWEHLERIAGKVRPGQPAKLGREELWDLGRLYSAAVSDLSLLKSSPLAADPDNQVISYLNGLVIRVHSAIYGKPPFRWSSITRFITRDFPRSVWQNRVYVYASIAIVFLSGLFGFLMALKEPAFIELLVPERIISTVEKGQVWFKGLYAVAPMASSSLMTHNISVTFLTFAAGLTFGIGTFYLLAFNGLLLGTIAALCYSHDLSMEFWSFVIPHGSVELSAIFIAGSGGLILGHALIDPGPYNRTDFLSLRSRQATHLVLGCVPMLIVAGIIEAFFSPSPVSPWLKIVVGAVLLVALWALFMVAGATGKMHEASRIDASALTD